MALTGQQALALRLRSLLLRPGAAGTAQATTPAPAGTSGPDSVAAVAEWFGAMQAQEYPAILWSLGRRLPGTTVADIEAALERGEAVRTWPMRGTIHLVPARDARWLVELAAPRPLAQAARRRSQLGLTEELIDRALDALGSALADGGRLTRSQCVEVFTRAGLPGDGPTTYHLLAHSCQRAITCLGPNLGREQTFVLLDDWLPDQYQPERDEALGLLATRYVRSHGPVTRQDFARWTGLPAADVTRGLAVADGELESTTLDGRTVYLAAGSLDTLHDGEAGYDSDRGIGTSPDRSTGTGPDLDRSTDPDRSPGTDPSPGPSPDRGFDALSGFDEYLLGYRDRDLFAAPEVLKAVVPGGNGVFRWTVTKRGRVVATWQRTSRTRRDGTRVTATVSPLVELDDGDRDRVTAALAPYGRFVDLPLDVSWQ